MTTTDPDRPTYLVAMSVAVGIIALACSDGVQIQRLPNGAADIKCKDHLPQCLKYADELCKGGSYEVLYASDEQHIYGGDQSQIEGRNSFARVHCLGPHDAPMPAASGVGPSGAPTSPAPGSVMPSASGSAAPVRVVGAAPVASGAAPGAAPAAKSERACVPGATQSCVGPGACAGGQACLPDGSGFGACDCGGGGATRAAP